MVNQKIAELLYQYFELGVAEGREGRTHDTEAGDAQRVLSEIEAEIAELSYPNLVSKLGRRIHNQRVRLRYWEELFNEHVHAHLHALHPRHLMKAIELGNENFHLRQLLSEAEKREKEARAKALEEAAQVADRYTFDEHALAQATDIGKAVHHQSVEIAVAIRALKSEER